jgi:hypothetical protein
MKQTNVVDMLKLAEKRYLKRMAKHDWFDPSQRPFRPSLRYYKKLGLFKASNVAFYPTTLEATSYDWWVFVKRIGGKIVFNSFRYSPTTNKHQSKVRSLLEQLGINIDFEISAPKGLQNLQSAIDHYEYSINALQQEIANPRSRKGKNILREQQIRDMQKQIEIVKRLQEMEELDARLAA